MLSRRGFLRSTAAAAALHKFAMRAFAFSQTSNLPLWKTAFRGVGPGGIPVAVPDRPPAPVTGVTHYTMDIGSFTDQICPLDLGPTTLYGYNPTRPLGGGVQPQRHLGGIIVAQKGVPIQITFRNNLPPTHIIPVDTTLPGADLAQNRTAVHLHGGHVPWISDGGPHDWWTPSGLHGLSFLNNVTLNHRAKPNEAEYFYPNDQSARMMWYHDHAWGITRINAYSGIASGYIIRDSFEIGLKNLGLPDFIELGGRELPIVVQDKIFVNAQTLTLDPTWPGSIAPGSLWYAHVYESSRWAVGKKASNPLPAVSCIPEFFGDTMLVNGTVYPEATVEARRYRLRLLNACNAKFLNLQMYVDNGLPDGIALNNQGAVLNSPFLNAAAPGQQGQPTANFLVIGSEGGVLPNAVYVPSNAPSNPAAFNGSLLLAPAERADVIVDFSGYAGQNIILYTDAPAPFPEGDSRDDYFPGLNVSKNPVNGTTPPGFGPNTRVMMRFKVIPATGSDAKLSITQNLDLSAGNDPLLVPPGVMTPPPGATIRPLTLNETFDEFGRLIQYLGTNVAVAPGLFGRVYDSTPTETPKAGQTEVWQIANLTGDTHPIHFHLANVQILSRQPFQVSRYSGVPSYSGPARPPDPNELGWKETVRMNPGEVTTVVMQFVIPQVTGFTIPLSPRTGGHEYVWHCHILEHEEHDMMRPLVVF